MPASHRSIHPRKGSCFLRMTVFGILSGAAGAAHAQYYPVEILPTAQTQPTSWKYTTNQPADDWSSEAFDDRNWSSGLGGFGGAAALGPLIQTQWTTPDIWLRKKAAFPATAFDAYTLSAAHVDDAEVFLNGVQIATLSGSRADYQDVDVTPELQVAAQAGDNTLAIHCHNGSTGTPTQFLDASLSGIAFDKPASARALRKTHAAALLPALRPGGRWLYSLSARAACFDASGKTILR